MYESVSTSNIWSCAKCKLSSTTKPMFYYDKASLDSFEEFSLEL